MHKILQAAMESRDAEALRQAFIEAPKEELSVPVLAQLLLENWHDSHEDIVFVLGLRGDPGAIEAIAKAVTIPFPELLKWGNLPEFQRKCAYALARIGTPESREALSVLATSSDPLLREYGEEGLQKWPLKYQPT